MGYELWCQVKSPIGLIVGFFRHRYLLFYGKSCGWVGCNKRSVQTAWSLGLGLPCCGVKAASTRYTLASMKLPIPPRHEQTGADPRPHSEKTSGLSFRRRYQHCRFQISISSTFHPLVSCCPLCLLKKHKSDMFLVNTTRRYKVLYYSSRRIWARMVSATFWYQVHDSVPIGVEALAPVSLGTLRGPRRIPLAGPLPT